MACAAAVVALLVVPVAAQTEDLDALNAQIRQLVEGGRLSDAIPIALSALALAERQYGPDHPGCVTALDTLAGLYERQERYADAESLLKRVLLMGEKALGPDHPHVAALLINLARVFKEQGRYVEAELLYKRSIAIRERALGRDHPLVASALDYLSGVYYDQDRYAEAALLLTRSLAITMQALGPDDRRLAAPLNNLAELYKSLGRYRDAEELHIRSLSISERTLGPDHLEVATSLNNLAALYTTQGRYADAERQFKRSLAIREKALGSDHSDVATSLNNLAALYFTQGRYADAEKLYERSLAILEKVLDPDHRLVGTALDNLAVLYVMQRDWPRAADFWRRSTLTMIHRAERGTDAISRSAASEAKGELERSNWQFWGLVKIAHQLATAASNPDAALLAETFETAQWARSSQAAASVAQMAARGGAKGSTALATVVRERQDLVIEWQNRDAARLVAISQSPDKRDNGTEAANTARLAAIDARLAEIDKGLARDFPDYAALASPKPLSIADVQSQLRSDEALVLFLDTPEVKPTPEETFIWVVTKTDVRWVRSDLGTKALTEHVAALRCGLDSAALNDEHCKRLFGDRVATKTLPFDITRAHDLYKVLFGQVEDIIQGKHLLIVPSGPLTLLPFPALVTEAPDPLLTGAAAMRKASWLARKNAVTILPAVSSLRALRTLAKESHASKPFLGIGNPLLDGQGPADALSARAAHGNQECPRTRLEFASTYLGIHGGVTPIPTRGNLADSATLRAQAPLPETADELCAVARDLGSPAADVHLGARATETNLKALSTSGALAQYRIVHFATHGAVSGELKGSAEPGLILTPPAAASETDDGYLSASEIAGLKLDADWVVLSACNTAAGGAENAEALSGLARAFFYAGARSLLVSHWAVNSNSTVKLITKAVAEIAADPTIGRAEAMRRSMVALIDEGTPDEAHPAYWAPFIVVGEGGAPLQTAEVSPAPAQAASTATGAPPASPEVLQPQTAPGAAKTSAAKPAAKPRPQPKADDDWNTRILGQ